MADGIVNSVLNKLSDAAVKKFLLILGVGEQAKALSRELSRIQAFLKDVDMKQIQNERAKNWVKEVRDVAYDIEDVIDNALNLNVFGNFSKVLPRGCARIVGTCKIMWSKCRKIPAMHNLAGEINLIQARIQEINGSRERYGINFLGEGNVDQPTLPVRPPVLHNIDDPYIVGFDIERDNIVKQLLNTSKNRDVISIVGPGGLGKTTLVRKVYNSNDVKIQFDVRIWVAISQEFNLIDILRKIMDHVEPLSRRDLEGGKNYLLTKLYKTLNGEKYTIEDYYGHPNTTIENGLNPIEYLQWDSQPLETNTIEEDCNTRLLGRLMDVWVSLLSRLPVRRRGRDKDGPVSQPKKYIPVSQPKKYLLVLDDIWTDDLWINIGGALPDAKNGSRVIITSRFLNIADDAKPYKLPCLTEKPSLELFFRKALPNRDMSKEYRDDRDDRDGLYKLGIQFVKKCGGLPLALVVLGGLLSKKPDNYAVWDRMLQTMNWVTDGKQCTDIIATSYNDLSFVLRSCFMYFAVFPEDYEIDTQRLFRLWVAEGFIPEKKSKTLEDIAESFLEDLVQRSLVQVSKRSHTGSITSCRIHDLLREVAIQKANEDNFLTICSSADNWESVAKARRVAVHSSGCDVLLEHANPNLRSLLCFEKPLPNCSRQRLLKVLSDIGHTRFVNFDCFHGLTQLRYCELTGSLFINKKSLESFIGGLKFVETLHGNFPDLPDDIWNVKTLRHVMLKDYTSGPSSSADLKNLQTLMGVRCRESWDAQLPKLPNVRNLDILVGSSLLWDLFAKLLDTLMHLTCLELHGCNVPENIVNMQRFPFYGNLQSLAIYEEDPYANQKLPLEVGMFPIHVIELKLDNLEFKEDLVPVLEKLPCLRMLYLREGRADQKMMSCSAEGFQQLRELIFDGLNYLEELEIKASAMPELEIVTLRNCSNLKVPLGLQYLSSLKELVVIGSGRMKLQEGNIRNMCKRVPSISISD